MRLEVELRSYCNRDHGRRKNGALILLATLPTDYEYILRQKVLDRNGRRCNACYFEINCIHVSHKAFELFKKDLDIFLRHWFYRASKKEYKRKGLVSSSARTYI